MTEPKPEMTIDGRELYAVPRYAPDFKNVPLDTAVYVTADGNHVYTKQHNDPVPRRRETFFTRAGYHSVLVADRARMMLHRLVALAFHGLPPDDSYVVARRSRDRADNRPETVYWATRTQASVQQFELRNPLKKENGARAE